MHKISWQQIYPKVLSVANFCDYTGKSHFQTNDLPTGPTPTNPPNPHPKQKLGSKRNKVGAIF